MRTTGSLSRSPISFVAPESPFSELKIELCNPMQSRIVEAVVVQEVKPKFFDSLRNNMDRVPVIQVRELYSYAEMLLEIGRELARQNYDIVIIPLRGGLKPWLQLDVLREFRQPPLWLPYTAGSQGKFDDQIMHVLYEGFKTKESTASLRFAVVDTAISGHGSAHLAEILNTFHSQDNKRQWSCDFHLLHARNRTPTETARIKPSHDNLKFSVILWPVEHLLVEDWNEAIGLVVNWEGNQRVVIKQCATEGQLLLRRLDGSGQLIESAEMHAYLDVLLGDALSEYVQTDPALEYQRDVWQRYVNR
jgi:hypothetical protein